MGKRKKPLSARSRSQSPRSPNDEASRVHIPTAEYQAVLADEDRTPTQVAYQRRNPDLDPQLVWRGKAVLDRSDLVVQAPPLFIQEKVHPKVLIPYWWFVPVSLFLDAPQAQVVRMQAELLAWAP